MVYHHITLNVKIFIFLGLLLSLKACTSEPPNLLANESLITQIFSAQEIENLHTILTFFEEAIGVQSKDDDPQITAKYHSYIDELYGQMRKGKSNLTIPIEEQLAMYETIDTQTFNQIWTLGAGYKKKWKGDTLRVIHLNYEGKYKSFLKLAADSIPIIKEKYYDRFHAVGHISPSMKADLIINKEQFDLKDIKIRLVFAIHYLTLNDESKRREKYNWKTQTYDAHRD